MSEGHAALARARSLVQVKRYDETIAALAPALTDPVTEFDAQCLRAQSLLGLGQVREAESAARRALQLEPNEEWPHRLLAICFQRRGKHKAARDEAREARRLAPYLPETANLLVICLINFDSPVEAGRVATEAVAQSPHSPLAHETAGLAAAAQKRWAEAEQHYRESLRLAPEDADVQRQLAEVLKHLGRREEAGETLLAAARTDPTSVHNRRSLARLGVPAVIGGGFVLKTALLKVVVVNALFHILAPTPAVALAAVALVVRVAWGLARRVLGTRSLPPEVRRGLWPEHWAFVLLWWFYSAIIALPLALYCWLGRQPNAPLAAALVTYSVLTVVGLFLTGHTPRVRWRGLRWRRPRWLGGR